MRRGAWRLAQNAFLGKLLSLVEAGRERGLSCKQIADAVGEDRADS